MKYFLIFISFLFLASCATFKPKEFSVEIDLSTVDIDQKPIDAVCSLYSSSSKIDILAPKKFIFNTECSSINVVCTSGDLYGDHGIINENYNNATEGFIISSGLGYLFDRAVETITPMGTFINLMSSDESDCNVNREITVVLE
ncbi:MAG: hypothetical protein HOJ42_03405 [Gammaproteobacteria bacterium]|nr:hypothetical protein [Gammaproteobacteria bacterium]